MGVEFFKIGMRDFTFIREVRVVIDNDYQLSIVIPIFWSNKLNRICIKKADLLLESFNYQQWYQLPIVFTIVQNKKSHLDLGHHLYQLYQLYLLTIDFQFSSLFYATKNDFSFFDRICIKKTNKFIVWIFHS